MTNLEGFVLLFVALGLFTACVVSAALLLVSIGWSYLRQERRGAWSIRINTVLAGIGVVLSLVAWAYVLVFVTPAGIVDHLVNFNPVLIVLLFGYTTSGVLGSYFLWSKQTGRHQTVTM